MRLAALLAILAGFWISSPANAQPGELRTLQPDRLPGMCLTMVGASVEAVSLPCTGASAEKFLLPGAEGGPIRFAENCLVPRGDGYYPPLVAATCDGSPAQTWKMGAEGELRSGEGRCISLLGQASRTGELIFAGDCPKQGEGHAWRARYVDFTNVIEASLESLARPGQCIGYDTNLTLYPCTDAYRQLISFDEKALGQLRMMSSCLSGGYAFGSLRLGECWDAPEQKWVLLEGGRVANAQAQCITVSEEQGRIALRVNACTQALEQQWRVRRPPAAQPISDTNAVAAEPAPTPVAPPAAEPAAPAATPVVLSMALQHEQLPGMCLSLSGRSGESESRPCDGSAIQTFALPVGAPGPIHNADLCLAPRGKGTYPQLVAVACDGAPDQTWTITTDGEIRSANGRCLALLGNSSRTGERIYAGECPTGLPAHRWRAVAVDPALLHPVSGMLEAVARPGKCLGTDGALGLVACDARLGRVFSFDTSAPSQLRMMGSCLAGGYVANSLALGQCWNMPSQKWALTAAGNLANLDSKCIVITVEGDHDALRTGPCLAVPEQRWTLKEVAP